jgi:hypothetical protein
MVNVTYSLFPVNGSYYNPAVTGVIEAAIAASIIITQEIQSTGSQGEEKRRSTNVGDADVGA